MRAVFNVLLSLGVATAGFTACAARTPLPRVARATPSNAIVAGIWDAVRQVKVTEGSGAGDTRVEQQEWHLDQRGPTVSGYYLSTLTFTSGDGRPYVCSRKPTFSAVVRFDVSGKIRGNSLDLHEVAERVAEGPCSLGERPLARYRAEVAGDVINLVNPTFQLALHRGVASAATTASTVAAAPAVTPALTESVRAGLPVQSVQNPLTVDVSGVWIWEHRGQAATGDEKQEREEWHVEQEGDRITGYYDRVVREISTDGQAFRCSMNLEFEIATRYKIHGEVKGNQLVIYENAFEVLEPNACDNGQRRLDAYEGLASTDEVRLLWGVGGQVLHRPRPDVPTQRF
jgi:hypothetical protein